jgi:hypothetical protein
MACGSPKVLRYEAPGCGAEAHPLCGRATEDACLRIACGCDGQLLTGCDYYEAPWRSLGLCPDTCYSPTKLDVFNITYQAPGCACDPASDKTECVSVRGEWHTMACAEGAWKIQPQQCEPNASPALDGGLDDLASPDAPDLASTGATYDAAVDAVAPDGGI